MRKNVNVLSVSEANQYAEVINFIENELCNAPYFVNIIKDIQEEFGEDFDLEYQIGNYVYYYFDAEIKSDSAVQAAVEAYEWKMYEEGENTIISWERKADYSIEIAA